MRKQILKTGALLALFAVLGAEVVAFAYEFTKDKIKLNEQAALLKSLTTLITEDMHDNNLLLDTTKVENLTLLGSEKEVTVYRARMQQQPVALVLNIIAPDGYNGQIYLLVGIRYDGSLLGVRVVKHNETPGLGDKIEEKRSDWILSFNDKSIDNPVKTNWAVKRDGGTFDQFTGATITPRAVVKAVYNSLLFYEENRDLLY
jgi:electron transport complex protein RnfG